MGGCLVGGWIFGGWDVQQSISVGGILYEMDIVGCLVSGLFGGWDVRWAGCLVGGVIGAWWDI